MRNKLTLFFIFYTLASFAQGEANNWYFGQNAAITFNSGTPVALTNSAMQTYEGCATLSDATGQLLFYTDGRTVYNRNHQVMANGSGLLGHESSTQSGTIVPLPGSNHLFYVFTLDYQSSPNGFRYSILDLNLDGGLGAITETKNVLIYTPSCEKISVVKHANDVDYWIVTRENNNDKFRSYLLTSAGLSSTPIISTSSYSISQSGDVLGVIKIAPNGSKVAVCYNHLSFGRLELLDFNTNTGLLSNSQIITTATSGGFYGAEFSPNSQLLYVSQEQSSRRIFQYNLSATPIVSSQIILFTASYELDFYPRTLQLGPDGKIYIAMAGIPFLSVINNPNTVGMGCNLSLNSISLNERICSSGLPVFNQSYFAPSIQLENACLGVATQFQLNNTSITSATWNFGDGNTSNSLSPTHTYSTAGTYLVSVTTTSPNGTGTASKEIVISAVPTATQPSNILVCDANNDGFSIFDLTTKTAAILNGQASSQFGVRYFANATDYANNVPITNPNSYQNATAYQLQTIIAEVYNLANQNCKASSSFAIQVFESPLPSTTVSSIQLCDNTSFGTDADGKVVFNLTIKQTEILNGQAAANFTVSYYKNAGLTDEITNPSAYVNTNAVETIYVKMTNNTNATCFATTSFQIEVFSLPVVAASVSLKQCDDNNDGFSAFNLTEANELVVASTSSLAFSYFETLAEAQNNTNPIGNFTTYSNQTVSNDQIFIRIQNAKGCFRTATLNLFVSTTAIPNTFQIVKRQCDDAASGSITDGLATFDFSDATTQIQNLFPSGQLLTITYYKTLNDALAEQNSISNIANHSNSGFPNTQNIYVRVDSQVDNECLGLGHHITLVVDPIPVVQPQILRECDDNQDGLFAFPTTTLIAAILNGNTATSVQFFESNGTEVFITNPFLTASKTLQVKVKNNFGNQCEFQSTLQFIVDDLPAFFPLATAAVTVCDDEINPIDQDGIFAFPTTNFQNTILGSQSGLVVSYFDAAGNPLPSPLPNPFETRTQNIRVVVTNPINPNCQAIGSIPFQVLRVPEIELFGEELICSNNPSFTKVIDAGLLDETTLSDFDYQWFLNGNPLPQTTYEITINTEGNYTVEVKNAANCIKTRTITVTASNAATIQNINVSDFATVNSITVLASGLGTYEYSLDNENYQLSPIFQDVPSGIYTVYVRDLKGCGVSSEEIGVLGYPKFFTPNADGFNDFWQLQGVIPAQNSETSIHIFDRYGKLITEIDPNSQGWNGTYNGTPLPASDYWFRITLQNGRIIKGNFALKR